MREMHASSAACVASCEECVNPQTERGKNRALSYLFKCQIQSRLQGDRIRGKGGRGEEGLQPQELRGLTSLPLPHL